MANSPQKVRIVFRNIKDKYGFTVLHHAVYRENLRLVNKLLKEKGVRAEEKDEQGNTALHLAALRKNVDMIKSLMRHKELILDRNREGQTPLHIAASTGTVKVIRAILSIEEGRRTLETEDSRHQTPLLIAASVGNKEVIDLLIGHGASIRKRKANYKKELQYLESFIIAGILIKRLPFTSVPGEAHTVHRLYFSLIYL